MATIRHSVPMVVQLQNPICWVACAAMILSWKRRQSVTIGDLLNGFDPSNSCIPNPAGSSWDRMYNMLSGWGITSVGPQICPAEAYITNILTNHGPFILTHYTSTLAPSVTGPGTHAVVVSGISTERGVCYFENPWGTANNEVPISTILAEMEKLWLLNLRSVAYASSSFSF